MLARRKSLRQTMALVHLTFSWFAAAPLWSMEGNQVPWVKDLPTAMEIAKQRNLLVLVHFTSDSCPPCRHLEQHVFNQAYFAHSVSQSFVPVCINVTLQPNIASDYQVQSWPTDVVLNPNGDELHRMVSPRDGTQYLRILQQVAWNQQQYQTSSSSAMLAGYRSDQLKTPTYDGNSHLAQAQSGTTTSRSSASGAQPMYGSQSSAVYQVIPQAETPTVTRSIMVPSNAAPADSIYATAADAAPQVMNNPYMASPPAVPAPSYSIASTSPPPMTPPSASSVDAGGQVQGTAFISSANPSTPASPPTGSPEAAPLNAFGLDGYCPVTVMDENQWVAGNRQWGAQHRGRVYLFRDAASQQRFLANPERYAPALAGFDPVLVTESGQYTPGRREHGVRYNDRMYLFGSEESLRKFSDSPDEYVARIEQALQVLAAK